MESSSRFKKALNGAEYEVRKRKTQKYEHGSLDSGLMMSVVSKSDKIGSEIKPSSVSSPVLITEVSSSSLFMESLFAWESELELELELEREIELEGGMKMKSGSKSESYSKS